MHYTANLGFDSHQDLQCSIRLLDYTANLGFDSRRGPLWPRCGSFCVRTMCELSASYVRRARPVSEYFVSGGGLGPTVPDARPVTPYMIPKICADLIDVRLQLNCVFLSGALLAVRSAVDASRQRPQHASYIVFSAVDISSQTPPGCVIYCIFRILGILLKYLFGSGYLLTDSPGRNPYCILRMSRLLLWHG